MRNTFLLILSALLLFPLFTSASETRVEAAGGLRTILDDETSNLDLFLDGNPAGLVLLNTKDRFDLAFQGGVQDQEGPWGSEKQGLVTTIPRSSDIGLRYEGLMVFPDPHWAFQAAGDYLVNNGVPITNYADDNQTLRQYRGLFRAAYGLSFGTVGVEVMDTQTDRVDDPGAFNADANLQSGNTNQNQTVVKAGFITTFPEKTSPHDPRWEMGGYLQTQLGSAVQTLNLGLFYPGNPLFQVTQALSVQNLLSWGTEILYEVPGVAKIRFATNLTTYDTDFEQDSPNEPPDFTAVPKLHFSQYQSMNIDGAFRLTIPFEGEENLKLGGNLTTFFNNSDLLRSSGFVYKNTDLQKFQTRFGIGLEVPKDYTLGFQWASLNNLAGADSLTTTTSSASTDAVEQYQLAFGGEKNLGSTWTLRMGLVGEVDSDPGNGTHTWSTTLNGGTGVEEAFGRMDIRVWLGQTTDFNNSNNTIELVGAQASMTLFL
jgi:hypothetical protein